MNEKRQVNGPPARLGRIVGPLVFVILTAAVCLLLLGYPLQAAPDQSVFEQSTLTLTNVLTPTGPPGPGKRIQTSHIDPAEGWGTRIQIPRIDKEEGWDTRIQAQNVSGVASGAVVFFWNEYSGRCTHSTPGARPADHACMQLSAGGVGTLHDQIPASAKSAILYSVSSDLYQAACEAAGIIDSHEAWMSWEDTYAYSGEPVAVTVSRTASNGSSASGMYNGFSENMIGIPYIYYAPSIMHGYDNFDSTITIQNSAEICCSVWLYYKEEGNCEFMKAQHVEQIAPGEAIRIGPGADADMPFPSPELDAPWVGSVVITA